MKKKLTITSVIGREHFLLHKNNGVENHSVILVYNIFPPHYVLQSKTCRKVSMLYEMGRPRNSHRAANLFWNNHTTKVVYSTNYSSCFHIYKNLLALQSPTVSICKTRSFMLFYLIIVYYYFNLYSIITLLCF